MATYPYLHTGCSDQVDERACEAADSAVSGAKCTWLPRRVKTFSDQLEVNGKLVNWIDKQKRAEEQTEQAQQAAADALDDANAAKDEADAALKEAGEANLEAADAKAEAADALVELEASTGLWVFDATDLEVEDQELLDAIEAKFQTGYLTCAAPTGDNHTGCSDQVEETACEAADSVVSGEKCTWFPRREKILVTNSK